MVFIGNNGTHQYLTPPEIRSTRFNRGLRGYLVEEVDEFIQGVAADMEAILAENARLQQRVQAMQRDLEHYRSLEVAMQEAITLARQTAEEIRQVTRAQSDVERQSVHLAAQEMEARVQMRLNEISNRFEMMRQERQRLIREVRAQLAAQIAWLDSHYDADPFAPTTPSTAVVLARPVNGSNVHGQTIKEASSLPVSAHPSEIP